MAPLLACGFQKNGGTMKIRLLDCDEVAEQLEQQGYKRPVARITSMIVVGQAEKDFEDGQIKDAPYFMTYEDERYARTFTVVTAVPIRDPE